MAELVQELTGCTQLQAEEALTKYHGNVVDAVESLIVKPKTKGDLYIPAKPKINTGLTPEQEELCRRGRDLQDKINAVVSVAHSQTQHGSSLSHEEQGEPTVVIVPKTETAELPLTNESRQDSSEQSPQ
jgi:hypothetical protein